MSTSAIHPAFISSHQERTLVLADEVQKAQHMLRVNDQVQVKDFLDEVKPSTHDALASRMLPAINAPA